MTGAGIFHFHADGRRKEQRASLNCHAAGLSSTTLIIPLTIFLALIMPTTLFMSLTQFITSNMQFSVFLTLIMPTTLFMSLTQFMLG